MKGVKWRSAQLQENLCRLMQLKISSSKATIYRVTFLKAIGCQEFFLTILDGRSSHFQNFLFFQAISSSECNKRKWNGRQHLGLFHPKKMICSFFLFFHKLSSVTWELWDLSRFLDFSFDASRRKIVLFFHFKLTRQF